MRAEAKCEARLEQQQVTLNKLLSEVMSIKRQSSLTPAAPTEQDMSVLQGYLPLKSYDQFQEFEEKLMIDMDVKKALVRYLVFNLFLLALLPALS